MKPIFITGDRLNIANYRLISLLISFSKIFEKIIYTRIYAHVVQNQILVKEQYANRSNLSTDNASYTLTHEILSAMNNKHIVGGILCDLSKAFDCVIHKILLLKLDHYRLIGTFKALIESYFVDRYQRVAIKDKTNSTNYSDWECIKHGVPQGSILGPLFFLLYINNLATVTAKNAKVMLYTDDTSLLINSTSPIQFANKLNTVFAEVNE